MRRNYQTNYYPDKQDIVTIDFDPAVGEEIRKRRPAVVLSNEGYSRITGLVVVSPVTHARDNRLIDFFVPISNDAVDGYVNPLQFFTYDFRKRHVKKIGLMSTPEFVLVQQTVQNILF